MTTPWLVLSGAAWLIQDLVNVTHNKVALLLYPETSLDTPIGERVFATIAKKTYWTGLR